MAWGAGRVARGRVAARACVGGCRAGAAWKVVAVAELVELAGVVEEVVLAPVVPRELGGSLTVGRGGMPGAVITVLGAGKYGAPLAVGAWSAPPWPVVEAVVEVLGPVVEVLAPVEVLGPVVEVLAPVEVLGLVVEVLGPVVEVVEEVPVEGGRPGPPAPPLAVDAVVVVAPAVEGSVVVEAVAGGLVTGAGTVAVVVGWLLVEGPEGGAGELVDVGLGAVEVGAGTVVVLGPPGGVGEAGTLVVVVVEVLLRTTVVERSVLA